MSPQLDTPQRMADYQGNSVGYDNPAMMNDTEEAETQFSLQRSKSVELPRMPTGEEEEEKSNEKTGYAVIAVTAVPATLIVSDGRSVSTELELQDLVSKRNQMSVIQHKRKPVRTYYKKQQELIEIFEGLSREESIDVEQSKADEALRNGKRAVFYSKLTLAVNTLLLLAKLVISVLSGSMSIISSFVDSVVDLLSGFILWWAARAIKKRDPYDYPQGRTKLEAVSIVILAVVMAMASLQLIRESSEKIITLISDDSSLPEIGIATFAVMGGTIVIKFVLWVLCRRVNSPIVRALALDHCNDCMSNSVAIVCGYLGSRNFKSQFNLYAFIFVDPIGAILISLYIIFNWWKTGSEQTKLLTGHSAKPDFLSKVTWIAMHHDPNITHIDTVRAYHYGSNFLVKVDVVVPEDLPLRDAHDIGESLQQKLESMTQVERAFVHVDYDFRHKPSSEHKVI